MTTILRGAPVAAALNEKTAAKILSLKERGVTPTLAILRVGERADDLSYERGALKRCADVGITVRHVVLPGDVSGEVLFAALDELNRDPAIHGILLFRPLPKHLDSEAARRALVPAKDVDGCTDGSLAGVFTSVPLGFPPCTAEAAIAILDYYGVDCVGKRAAVIGRSLVVGRPSALMLLEKNATVTICHTKTVDVPSVTREADILVVCAGKMQTIGKEYLRPGQIVIDVGIGWDSGLQRLCGDVVFEDADGLVSAISPVPGGVGSVTTAVLVSHVAEAARRQAGVE